MPWTPRTTVAAIAEQDGQFLFVLENINGKAVINQPAGHLEKDETLVRAVEREMLEETAWQFEPQGLVGIYKWRIPEDGPTYMRYCFYGKVLDHNPAQALDDGILEAVWLTPEQVSSGKYPLRSPMVMRCLNDYLAGCHYPLDLINEVD